MWLFDGVSALLLKTLHVLASPFHTTVLSQYGESDTERLREHVDIWDKDYGVIMNECLCCVSLSLLTLLSDWGMCCRTEPGPMSVLYFYTLELVAESSRLGSMWITVSREFKTCCQSAEASSLPWLQCVLTRALRVPLLN